MRRLYKYLLIIPLISACSRSGDFDPDLDMDYFPLKLDNQWTYQVMEIHYEISGFDTVSYLLRESIIDTIQSGRQLSYVINSERSEDEGMTWNPEKVWTVRQTAQELIVIEDNQPKTKMVYPVRVGKSWNQNNYNTLPEMPLRYTESDINTSGIQASENILVVISDIPANIVNQDQQYERYGKGVGLIEKKSTVLNFCTVNCNSPGQIMSGYFLDKSLIDFSLE